MSHSGLAISSTMAEYMSETLSESVTESIFHHQKSPNVSESPEMQTHVTIVLNELYKPHQLYHSNLC